MTIQTVLSIHQKGFPRREIFRDIYSVKWVRIKLKNCFSHSFRENCIRQPGTVYSNNIVNFVWYAGYEVV